MEPLNSKKNEIKNEIKLEIILSYMLIAGVIVSLSLMITGIILFYINTGNLNISRSPQMFIKGQNFFHFIYELLQGQKLQSLPVSFIVAGTVILMLTPFIRVVASLIYFATVKDLKYVLITFIVLAILTISLSMH
ncbi:MAG: DUF1634 domain-containing protein [Candidatus Humimicrobiaceae bacterium]